MSKEYVEMRNGGYYVAGSRVSLDSVVYDFLEGLSPESIVEDFPTLSLEQVFGALAYYLANREEIEKYLRANEQEFEERRKQAREANPLLYKKLEEGRRQVIG
jgi:uncharacterized protein (DUF433 family)